MAYVYTHTRIDNNDVFYVGISSTKNYKRAYRKDGRSDMWRKIAAKTEYVVHITHDNILWEEACVIEKYLISFYGQKRNGSGSLCNITLGGDGVFGFRFTEESKKKMSESHKGKRLSDQAKEKLRTHWKGRSLPLNFIIKGREARKGKKYFLGRTHSEETRKKMSNSRKGVKLSEEAKKKLSDINKGKSASEETRAKLRVINRNRKHSEESKRKISKNHFKKRRVIDSGTGIYYESASEAARLLGYKANTLMNYLTGFRKNKTTLKYV